MPEESRQSISDSYNYRAQTQNNDSKPATGVNSKGVTASHTMRVLDSASEKRDNREYSEEGQKLTLEQPDFAQDGV